MEVDADNSSDFTDLISIIWFSSNEEGWWLIPPFIDFEAWNIGPFGVWSLVKGAVTVTVGAAILLALRRCFRRRRSVKTEIEWPRPSSRVEIHRVDTPTKLRDSSFNLTIIPSPSKPVVTEARRAPVDSPVQTAKINFKTEADDDDDDDDKLDEAISHATDDTLSKHVQENLVDPMPPDDQITTGDDDPNVAVIAQETAVESSELTFNLTFTDDGDSDSEIDESHSQSIKVTDLHTNSATGHVQRLHTGDDDDEQQSNKEEDMTETVVTKTMITVL